ncbi:hypothetical protein L3Y34_018406 [Caenorhabditis briggsae]|uniref:Diacylglycerol kinase n=1 Tax=Caenorhabditis briggsae TaxID=6238 RepID=A0AAE9DLU1_CAEBR|nr:hypothetical protein L3Y34_018406 [Caenorhabditis briggsae]
MLRKKRESAQEAVSLREAAERRSQFARVPARSVSAPPRKKWFRSKQQLSGATDGMDGSSRAGSQEIVCDEFTKKLVAAITTWHDIHSSLLQLSIERSSNDSNDDENVSESSESSWSSASDSDSDDDGNGGNSSNHLSASAARFSISNPDLTNCQIKQMFPEMADHWRYSSYPSSVSSVDWSTMMMALRKNSSTEDAFLPTSSTSGLKKHRKKKKSIAEAQSNPVFVISADPSGASPSTSPKPAHKRKKRSWRGESAARKLSEALPAALRSPTQILKRTKKPLGPSLSWDPEHRSRSPSMTRSRVHSDGSSETGGIHEGKNHEEDGGIVEEPRFELEITCIHCTMAAEHRRRMLKTEIESAVMRLARRLGNGRSGIRDESPSSNHSSTTVHRHTISSHHRGTTPDIVVSSISSDEEDHSVDRYTSSELGNSLQTSEASSPGSSTCTSPNLPRNGNEMTFDSPGSDQLTPPSPLRLQPPSLLSPYPDSASPPRSNSVDLSTLRRDIELLSVSSGDSDIASDTDFEPPTPAESVRTFRSKSHDPTNSDSILRRPSRMIHLSEIFRKALAKSPVVRRTAADQETNNPVNKHRSSRYWIEDEGDYHILPSEHVWLPSSTGSSASADSECYVGEKDCRRSGEKRRCAACHVVAHTNCFSLLAKLNLNCKTTFRDYATKKTPTKESTDGLTAHHWVHKWRHEGRCNTCGKSFQQKMFFQGKEKKETIAVACSWCKESYHLKNCFARDKLEERCNRGALKEMIVPPTWILRLANRKRSSRAPSAHPRKHKRSHRQFVVKPTDLWSSGPSQPLLVFVNPKSGGNKGSKALHTLCWLLNPRQVFDITSLKGPKFGLEMFRKVVTQLRILVCGGDGTVGWVLSTLDNLNWPAYPPMAIMPLGTGNDLARCMGWGGVFSDEPISQLMQAILHETIVTHLDRWRIDVEPNTSCNLEEEDDGMQSALPLTVMNNYFSIGADAHVALQFHHSRSANPQMLNSRLKNRIAYGGLGTIDLFKRSWKDLSEYITLECDGVDVTSRIKELKLHCILFHNITYYAGGTIPWGESSESKPSCCDGKVEVLGFTTATLAALQMGGKGERISQCSRVKVTTNKAIPMQVDGEPCLLAPSVITLGFHSKVPMLKREKKTPCTPNLMRRGTRYGQKDSQVQSTSLIIQLPVIVVGRADYDTYKDCFERLKDTAYEIGIVNVESEAELDSARVLIQRLLVEHNSLPYEPDKNWRFLDYVSNAEEGTFRVSRQQEHVQSVSDVCNTDECLLILDHAFPSITDREAVELFQPQQPVSSSTSSSTPRYHNSRRISETLRIVLSSDAQETHL